jgi:hypothetical protein
MKRTTVIYIALMAVVLASCGTSKRGSKGTSASKVQVPESTAPVQRQTIAPQQTAAVSSANKTVTKPGRVISDSVLKARAIKDSLKLLDCPNYLWSKVRFTLPKSMLGITLGGKMKMKKGERVQLSLVLPIIGTEEMKADITPNDMLLIDRHDKMYVQATKEELMQYLPAGSNFAQIEVLLFEASKPGGKSQLSGEEVGIKSMKDATVELYDFSSKEFDMEPSTAPASYKKVTLEKFIKALKGLQ